MNDATETSTKKLQMSHANHYRLCKWIEGNSERIKELTLDELVSKASDALRIPVSRNAAYDAAKICGVPLRRKGRTGQLSMGSRSKTSAVLAASIVHLYDQLGLNGSTSAVFRERLIDICQHRKAGTQP